MLRFIYTSQIVHKLSDVRQRPINNEIFAPRRVDIVLITDSGRSTAICSRTFPIARTDDDQSDDPTRKQEENRAISRCL